METLTDLVTKAQRGDMEAFEEIYTHTYKQVYFTCISFLKNEQDAADMTQEVYVTAMQTISTLKDAESFESWIGRMAVNKCINFLKKNRIFPVEEETLEELVKENDELLLPEEYAIQDCKRKIIVDIMKESLSDTLYQTIVLYYFQNMPVNDIATLMECPVSTVTARLSKARAKIKEGILKYEKKSHDKLYAVAMVPILALFFQAEAKASTPTNMWSKVKAVIPESKPDMRPVTMGGKIMLKSLKAKILLAVLAFLLIGGAIAAVIVISNRNMNSEPQNEIVENNREQAEDENLLENHTDEEDAVVGESDEFVAENNGEEVDAETVDYHAMAEDILAQIELFFPALTAGDYETVLAMSYQDSEVYEDFAKMCEYDCTTQFLQTIYGDVKYCINEETVDDLARRLETADAVGAPNVAVPVEYSVPLLMVFSRMYYAAFEEGEVVTPTDIVAKVAYNDEAFPILDMIMDEVPMVKGTGFEIILPDENGEIKIILDWVMGNLEIDDLPRIDEYYPANYLCDQLQLSYDGVVGAGAASFRENDAEMNEIDRLLQAKDFAGLEAYLSSITGEDYGVKYGDQCGHYADLTDTQKAFVDNFVNEEFTYDLVDYVVTEDNNYQGSRFGTFILTFPILYDWEDRDILLTDWYAENDVNEYAMAYAGNSAQPADFEYMLYLYYTVIKYAAAYVE